MDKRLQERTIVEELVNLNPNSDSEVCVAGWVNSRRDHGQLIFIDLRDHSGLVQLVFQPDQADAFSKAEKLGSEWVIEARGKIVERQADMVNPKIKTGKIEIIVTDLVILNQSKTPPIPVNDETTPASEAKRFLYRYLDLRRPHSQWLLRYRAQMMTRVRNYMESNNFVEIATPLLANSSPEGSRDYLVPSRLHPGKFYALPQAPQQFKQLLMIGGFDRYYQIANNFRDEDPRADRLYGDFYQLDVEMGFVQNGEVVQQMMEPLITDLVVDFANKKVDKGRIIKITHKEALDKYGCDKPDLRYDLFLENLDEVFANSPIQIFKKVIESGGTVKAIVVPNDLGTAEIEKLRKLALNLGNELTFLKLTDENKLKGPLAKLIEVDVAEKLINRLQLKTGQTVLMSAGSADDVNQALDQVRRRLAVDLDLIDSNLVSLVWITDFPFYELTDDNKLDFAHNPFSKPMGDPSQGSLEDKLALRADQFDMAMNGYEICSGAVRNWIPDLLMSGFREVGYSDEEIKSEFRGILGALEYGAPPHSGCGYGLDRIFMVLSDEPNIRNIIAFPKNGSGVDTLMGSPSKIKSKELAEFDIKIVPNLNKKKG